MFCSICGGEIPVGWPIVNTDHGPAHRFRSTCNAVIEDRQEEQTKADQAEARLQARVSSVALNPASMSDQRFLHEALIKW